MTAAENMDAGARMFQLIERLYPIYRSITGDGVRQTLAIIQELIPLQMHEVASGTPVFDWLVPKEWNIRDAYIKNAAGECVVDFRQHNLHVVNYSVPVRARMTLQELKPHLHTLPDHPDWIPYRTSYYDETWGFCLTQRQFENLPEGEYDVHIDATLVPGHLTYGEYFLPGESTDEVLFYTHVCHPALCNDNLSGIAVSAFLAHWLGTQPRRYSYRFVFAPGTIGSITWLSRNEAHLPNIKHGLIVALVGDAGGFTLKKTRQGDAPIDRVMQQALHECGEEYAVVDFTPYGYDERQFCSPGINLPVARLTRTPNGEYPQYHTSADNLEFVMREKLAAALRVCKASAEILEKDRCYLNTHPKGEPQLGKRGLYRKMGGQKDIGAHEHALLWVLNLSDGEHSLLDIAKRSGLRFDRVAAATDDLLACGLLREIHRHGGLK